MKKLLLILLLIVLLFSGLLIYREATSQPFQANYVAVFTCSNERNGTVYGTVNLIFETESQYYVEYHNRITKRNGKMWLSKVYFRLEKIYEEVK